MQPKQNESKQDFLNRCTSQLIEQEGQESDRAFASCNLLWEKAQGKASRRPITLAAPLQLKKGEAKGKRLLMITAYTGKKITAWWGSVLIDISGIEAKSKFPILREHDRARIVGYSEKAWSEKGNYFVKGSFSDSTPDSKEVQQLADEGFPWQASVGISPLAIKRLASDKETMTVNGAEVKGPLEVWTQSALGEVSVCSLGADDGTATIALSGDQATQEVPFELITTTPLRKNKEEVMNIQTFKAEHPALYKAVFEAGQTDAERKRCIEIMKIGGISLQAKIDAIKQGTPVEQIKAHLWDQGIIPQAQPSGQSGQVQTDYLKLVKARMAEAKCSQTEAQVWVLKNHPDIAGKFAGRTLPVPDAATNRVARDAYDQAVRARMAETGQDYSYCAFWVNNNRPELRQALQ
ncbi:hypothetical protein JXQ70_19810 [bacterium]|nr:hypothetical protein [bacterium]